MLRPLVFIAAVAGAQLPWVGSSPVPPPTPTAEPRLFDGSGDNPPTALRAPCSDAEPREPEVSSHDLPRDGPHDLRWQEVVVRVELPGLSPEEALAAITHDIAAFGLDNIPGTTGAVLLPGERLKVRYTWRPETYTLEFDEVLRSDLAELRWELSTREERRCAPVRTVVVPDANFSRYVRGAMRFELRRRSCMDERTGEVRDRLVTVATYTSGVKFKRGLPAPSPRRMRATVLPIAVAQFRGVERFKRDHPHLLSESVEALRARHVPGRRDRE